MLLTIMCSVMENSQKYHKWTAGDKQLFSQLYKLHGTAFNKYLPFFHGITLSQIKSFYNNQLHKNKERKNRKMNQDDKHATDSPQTPNKHLVVKAQQSHQEKPISIPSNPPTIVNQHPDQTQIFARMEYAAPLSEPAIIPEEVQVKAAVNLEYEYDMGLNDDTPYYVRELIDGADYFNYSPYRFDE
ncbi:Homeobox-like_domain superfamily [Hexamita inflata]|uniref:Homeobox-like domain superfamily n=1 Tax=Hexamita inflata TaxID=28002 RepID=A0AA86Q5P1_9EUKA|nr:Homeobox-like domain superfamily [Hexamita inflata]CAI9952815.1 Homeobox-like domain superfamily [Hexamita inflata]